MRKIISLVRTGYLVKYSSQNKKYWNEWVCFLIHRIDFRLRSQKYSVSADSGVDSFLASWKLALDRFSTKDMAIFSGSKCWWIEGVLINIKGRPMAEMVRQKKIMRTRVFAFIAIFNFIFAFGKDNKRWAQRQTENSFPIWLCRTESHLRIYKDSDFFNGLCKKSYKRNMDLIYLYNL